MLIFPLKKEWYEKILSGEKRVEYREVKPYWTKRLKREFVYLGLPNLVEGFFGRCAEGSYLYVSAEHRCTLRLGYTKRRLTAKITGIKVVNGRDTDLHIDKLVYAIHFANVNEEF